MSILEEAKEEFERLKQLTNDRELTIGEELCIQHIWAKTRELNNHFINKDATKEFNKIRSKK